MEKTRVVNLRDEPCDVFIGRPSKWGNPFKIGKGTSREKSIKNYRMWIVYQPRLLYDLPELKGKKLGCYCKPLPCHGDVLVELINYLDEHPRILMKGQRFFERYSTTKPPSKVVPLTVTEAHDLLEQVWPDTNIKEE